MKTTAVLMLIFILQSAIGQNTISIVPGDYCFIDSYRNTVLLKLKHNLQFEFIIDADDCSFAFQYYGRGKYTVFHDSVFLFFDFIANEKSLCCIDSTRNNDKKMDIQLCVTNQEEIPLEGLTLHWTKPKKKWNWTTTAFFEEQFDNYIQMRFRKNEKINSLRITKEGYYEGNIDISRISNKDYVIQVEMRPKPEIESVEYLSGITAKFPLVSADTIVVSESMRLIKKR